MLTNNKNITTMKKAYSLAAACGLLLAITAISRADLVINGGFETGDFTGWTTGGTLEVKPGAPGSNFVNTGSHGVTLGAALLSQAFVTTPGHVYDLSIWMNEIPLGGVGLLEIKWDNWSVPPGTDYGTITLLNSFAMPDPIVGPGWAKYDFMILALGNVSTLEFNAQTQAVTYPNNIGIDDISLNDTGIIQPLPILNGVPIGSPSPILPATLPYLLSKSVTLATPVPEPSAYSLLGVLALGGAALWRRHRR